MQQIALLLTISVAAMLSVADDRRCRAGCRLLLASTCPDLLVASTRPDTLSACVARDAKKVALEGVSDW